MQVLKIKGISAALKQIIQKNKMRTLFSVIQFLRMIYSHVAVVLNGGLKLQPVKQPVYNGIVPLDKIGINTMILYPAK